MPIEDLSARLEHLAHHCEAWAAVLLVADPQEDVLRVAAHHGLPSDWVPIPNRLSSDSMNARAFRNEQEIVEEGFEEYLPPTDQPVSRHKMTAAAVVLVPGVGTLEVLADEDGYHFDGARMDAIRRTATEVSDLLRT